MPRVLIPLATGFEELEAVTMIDLLRRAGIEVVTAGLESQPAVRAARGTVIVADTLLAEVQDQTFDMVALPGGLPGADHLRDDPRIARLLSRHNLAGHFTAAICAAPKVLAAAGVLKNRTATAYPGVLEALELSSTALSNAAVEVDGKVVTSRGPGTAMDFALVLIELLVGAARRNEVEAALCRDSR
ncbi:MAG: DJ-1 family glyoxalase III [Thiotrichales bacterium]